MDDRDRFVDRIWRLRNRARDDRESFSSPDDPPAEDEALEYLREGAGQAISLYVEARTGGQMVHFSPDEYDALEAAMNTWLELYAACYGVDIDAKFTVRTAAELLVDTHNVADVAQLLTGVPER